MQSQSSLIFRVRTRCVLAGELYLFVFVLLSLLLAFVNALLLCLGVVVGFLFFVIGTWLLAFKLWIVMFCVVCCFDVMLKCSALFCYVGSDLGRLGLDGSNPVFCLETKGVMNLSMHACRRLYYASTVFRAKLSGSTTAQDLVLHGCRHHRPNTCQAFKCIGPRP